MSDALLKLVADHGLAAVLAVVAIVLQLWWAKWAFANFRGQNNSLTRIERDLGRLLERNKLDSVPPPIPSAVDIEVTKRNRIFPRKATPLPFWPVPQPDDDKETP